MQGDNSVKNLTHCSYVTNTGGLFNVKEVS